MIKRVRVGAMTDSRVAVVRKIQPLIIGIPRKLSSPVPLMEESL